MTTVLGFIIGACIGSFVACAVYRLPRNRSLLNPPSSCPACGHVLRWYENIPIFSWLIQRGRARCCEALLSPSYLLIETLGALLGGFVAWLAF
ncbi:MAG: prepilin peptidase [Bdellovibrionales bacterium]